MSGVSGQLSTIGGRIKYVRQINRLSQREMSDILRVTSNHVWQIESGRKGLGPSLGELVLVTFGVSREWLMDGVGEAPRPRTVYPVGGGPAIVARESTVDEALKTLARQFGLPMDQVRRKVLSALAQPEGDEP